MVSPFPMQQEMVTDHVKESVPA